MGRTHWAAKLMQMNKYENLKMAFVQINFNNSSAAVLLP